MFVERLLSNICHLHSLRLSSDDQMISIVGGKHLFSNLDDISHYHGTQCALENIHNNNTLFLRYKWINELHG